MKILYYIRQLCPRCEVQGTADAYGGAYLPILQLPRTHSRLLIIRGLRTEGQGRTGRVIERRTLFCAPFPCRLWRRGWCTSRAPCDHLFAPQHELPPARLALHRQTSAHERRKGPLKGSIEVGHFIVFMHPAYHWLWITVELHIPGARYEEVDPREGGRYALVRRVSGSELLSLRTHRHRGRSRPLRSAVVEYQAPSVAD